MSEIINDCKEHWYDHYGSEKCSQCQDKKNEKDRPDLRMILKRRADALMELDKTSSKSRRQER